MRSFLAPALFVVAIGVVLTSCGGGGETSPSLREYAPANLMIEHSHITYVGCGDPYGPRHVYTCEFLTSEHKGTMGIAEVVITDGGKGYKVETCNNRSRKRYALEPTAHPCATFEGAAGG
jgi:hypothetical protein